MMSKRISRNFDAEEGLERLSLDKNFVFHYTNCGLYSLVRRLNEARLFLKVFYEAQ